MASVMPWKFGVPTGPDVKKLSERWPATQLKPGDTITKKEVSELVGEPENSNRFDAITNAWRKSMEPDILIICPGDKTFVVASESDKVRHAKGQFKAATKKVRRGAVVISWVDVKQLDEVDKKMHLLLTHRVGAFRAALQARGNGDGTTPSLLE